MTQHSRRRGITPIASALLVAAVVAGTTTACVATEGPQLDDGSARTLVVVQAADVQNLNNNIEAKRSSSRITGEIMESAIRIEYGPEGPVLEPGLAESWEQTSPTTWRFKVRPGVTFTNGEKLTALAFAKSLETYRENPAGFITGLMSNFEIEVVDDLTFDIVTSTENLASLPAQMSWMSVLAPEYSEGKSEADLGQAPVGTGPYLLSKWEKGVAIHLSANPDYWGEQPKIRELTIKTIADAATRISMLETGDVDIVADVPTSLAARVDRLEDASMQWVGTDTRRVLILNMNAGPTTDVRVRKAINHAIDRESIATQMLDGQAEPLQGVFSAGELGYNGSFKGYDYDPKEAKRLLAEAGYADGVEIDFNYTIGAYSQDKEVAEAIAAQLGEVGFKVNMLGGPYGTLLPKWRTPGESSGIYMMSPAPVYPDSSFIASRAYLHPESVYGSVWGSAPSVAKLADEGLATTDVAQRQEVYEKLSEEAIMREAMWVPLFSAKSGWAIAKDVQWTPPADDRFYFEHAAFGTK